MSFVTADEFSVRITKITSRINCRFFLKIFSVYFNLFVLLFFVTPYLVVAVQPCMELMPIKEKTRKN